MSNWNELRKAPWLEVAGNIFLVAAIVGAVVSIVYFGIVV